MYKHKSILPILFVAVLLWGCNKGGNLKPNSQSTGTAFSDTTFSNWEILGKDYPAVLTHFVNSHVPNTYLEADNADLTQEIAILFNKRPPVNATYEVRDFETTPTDTTCSIAVFYNNGDNTFFSGNAGVVTVTILKGKVTAYFSDVNVGGTGLKTDISGCLIEQ